MTAGSYDLTIEQGATFDQTLIWLDENGTPINLTGYTAKMQIKSSKDIRPTVIYHTLDSTLMDGSITFDLLNGKIFLHIPASTTETFVWTKGVYDINMINGSYVTKLIRGSVSCIPMVTE